MNYLLQTVYAALGPSWVDLMLPSLAPAFANGAKDLCCKDLCLCGEDSRSGHPWNGSKMPFMQSTWSLVQLCGPAVLLQPRISRSLTVQELHLLLHMAHKVNMFRLAWKLLGFLLQKQMLKHFKGSVLLQNQYLILAVTNTDERALDQISLRKGRRRWMVNVINISH